MIVVLLSYKVDPSEIDRLKQGLADGRLLASGRKMPVTGGMLLCRGTLDEVKAWTASDPFAIEGVAEYEVFEIATSMTAPGLEALAG